MHAVHTGVCSCGFTFDSVFENGSWSSRAIPNASRIVDVMIDMQQTKMAADDDEQVDGRERRRRSSRR